DLYITGGVAEMEVAVDVGVQQFPGNTLVVALGGAGEAVVIVAAAALQTWAVLHLVIEGLVIPGGAAQLQAELALIVPTQLAVPVHPIGDDIVAIIGTGPLIGTSVGFD